MMSQAELVRVPAALVPSDERRALRRRLFAELQDLWEQGEAAPAEVLLARHPELQADKSLVLDLAYEEYCRNIEAGRARDPREFCAGFRGWSNSVDRAVGAHIFLEANARLLTDPKPPTPWPAPGDLFLGFTLQRELGRGAFARVFLATENALGHRQVAVKVSLRGAREAQILGRITHSNIVPVHSIREDEPSGLTVVCMPYLGSATLATVLDRVAAHGDRPARARIILDAAQDAAHRGTDPDRVLLRRTYLEGVLHLGAQLAGALAFIHKEGICHQDLKPSNVLMDPDGRPMLLDFNLSFDRQAAGNRLGGTLPYMAPEQLRVMAGAELGPFSQADARTDLFSLGVILYELLAGKHPFGPNPLASACEDLPMLLVQRQAAGALPLRRTNADVDPAAARAIERCLALDPAERPRSAGELAAALQAALSPLRRVRRRLAAHGLPLLRATALALAAGAATAGGVAVRECDGPAQLRRGQEARQHGDPVRAVLHFSQALQADPDLYPALVGRGQAYLQLGQFAPALEDFARADTQLHDGRICACRGYCLSRLGYHQEAIDQYERALDAGFTSPELFNDLGYSYWHLHNLDKAQAALQQASEKAPGLATPYHNLALMDLARALARSQYVPEPGIEAIESAIRVSPPPASAALCRDAARLYALAARNPPILESRPGQAARRTGYIGRALDYASRAVEQGWDPRDLKGDPALKILQSHPGFQTLVAKPPPDRACPPAILVLDPGADIP
jgi:serine/threonine protein kinase/Tfp pilus assembly protein PilF